MATFMYRNAHYSGVQYLLYELFVSRYGTSSYRKYSGMQYPLYFPRYGIRLRPTLAEISDLTIFVAGAGT